MMLMEPLGFFSENSVYELFLTENWIMILIAFLLSVVLAVSLVSKPIVVAFVRETISSRRKQKHPIWHEDALFMESFGKLYDDLNSESTKQLMDDYHQQEPHVTHFCFLVHGFAGFSKVRNQSERTFFCVCVRMFCDSF